MNDSFRLPLRRLAPLAAALPLLGMLACAESNHLKGQVLDIWENPIEGATVKIEGESERPLTDELGRFRLSKMTGDHMLKAGKEGYILAEQNLAISEEGTADTPVFRLYPEPEQTGFYLVGMSEYEHIKPVQVDIIGNDLKALYGLKGMGTAQISGAPVRIIYHTDLPEETIQRLTKKLHRLKFQEDAELTGAITTTAKVNLWVSEEATELDFNPMPTGRDFLLEFENLPVGDYALVVGTQNLLDEIPEEDFRKAPKELRVVFPFKVIK